MAEAAPTADGPTRDELLKELELWGIVYDPQQVSEGEEPWEVIAEPEPQYFNTFAEAFKFFSSLQDNPETLPSPPAGQGRGE